MHLFPRRCIPKRSRVLIMFVSYLPPPPPSPHPLSARAQNCENESGTYDIPDVDIWLPVCRPRRSSSSSSRFFALRVFFRVYVYLRPRFSLVPVSPAVRRSRNWPLSVRGDSDTLLGEGGDAQDHGSLTYRESPPRAERSRERIDRCLCTYRSATR